MHMITIQIGEVIVCQFEFICLFFFVALGNTRGAAACEALKSRVKSFDILQLPSGSLLQSYTGTFLHEPAQYVSFKAQCEKQGKHFYMSDGVLVVKVACQLMWNSQNNTLSGLTMTSKDLTSLTDVYQQAPKVAAQTFYIQFLW